MATPFQPEQPHDPVSPGTGKATTYVTAIISALAVVMLLAVTAPRITDNDGLNWAITLGAGVLTFAVVVAIGLARGARNPVVRQDAPPRS